MLREIEENFAAAIAVAVSAPFLWALLMATHAIFQDRQCHEEVLVLSEDALSYERTCDHPDHKVEFAAGSAICRCKSE